MLVRAQEMSQHNVDWIINRNDYFLYHSALHARVTLVYDANVFSLHFFPPLHNIALLLQKSGERSRLSAFAAAVVCILT